MQNLKADLNLQDELCCRGCVFVFSFSKDLEGHFFSS